MAEGDGGVVDRFLKAIQPAREAVQPTVDKMTAGAKSLAGRAESGAREFLNKRAGTPVDANASANTTTAAQAETVHAEPKVQAAQPTPDPMTGKTEPTLKPASTSGLNWTHESKVPPSDSRYGATSSYNREPVKDATAGKGGIRGWLKEKFGFGAAKESAAAATGAATASATTTADAAASTSTAAAATTSTQTPYEASKENKLFNDKWTPERDKIASQKTQITDLEKKIGDTVDATAKENLVKTKDGIVEQLGKDKDALQKTAGEAFEKDLKLGDRLKSSFAGNFSKSASTTSKVFRGGGVVAGIGAMIDGGRRLVSPEVDEKTGERKDGVWTAVAEMGAGAGAVYLSAITGGRNKAMGLA